MSARGFTLVEALLSMAILGLLAVAMVPAYQAQLRSNTRSEIRSAAVLAAQEVLEALRAADPATLPSSGVSAPQTVTTGRREFDVLTLYCVRAVYCDATSRHLTVEVFHGGRKTYDVETVYTQLR